MDPEKPRSLTPESFKAVAKAVEDITGSTSLPPAEKAVNERHKMDLSARTDWFMGFLVFVLILVGRIPVEPYFWAMVALGSPSAVASMLHLLGLRRSAGASMTALIASGLPWLAKAAAARIVMVAPLAFMLSCATLAALGTSALQALAPVAVDAIKAALANDPETKCVELADEYQPDQAAVVTCVGEDINAAIDPAGEALNAQAAADGETIDPRTALCEPVDADGVKGAVVVCGALYAEDDE